MSGPAWKRTLTANATANLVRNLWAYAVIFCGHFPDGAEKFTGEHYENETHAEWYLRQMLGSANFKAGPAMAFMSGNLCYQIEHHLFPDLPSNRYAEISVRVRELCDKYDLPYTTGSLLTQYMLAFRTIHKLALPDQWLLADRGRCAGDVVGAQVRRRADRHGEPARSRQWASRGPAFGHGARQGAGSGEEGCRSSCRPARRRPRSSSKRARRRRR